MSPFDIILRPWSTEKALEARSQLNRLEFIVRMDATKAQIRRAVESLLEHVGHHLVEPRVSQSEVDESGPGDLDCGGVGGRALARLPAPAPLPLAGDDPPVRRFARANSSARTARCCASRSGSLSTCREMRRSK